MAFFLVCLWALFLAVLACYVKQLVIDTRRHVPPGPWPLPIIGNILHLSKLPHRSLARLAERHGSPMTLRLGTSLFIVVSSPSTAREVLQTQNASLSGRNPADAWSAGGHGANSIFVLQPGRKWRTLRKVAVTQLFSPRRLDELQPLRQHVVRRLLGDVLEVASGGAPVSVRRAAFTAMARLLWRAMFSDEPDDDVSSQELYDCVRGIISLVMTPNVSDLFPAVAAADLQGVRRRMAPLVVRMYQMMDRQIECRKRARESGGGDGRTNDLLDVMLDMWEQEDDGRGVTINRDVIRAFCMDLFIAALDTTSNTIEWAFAELLQNPQIMIKLQEELKIVLGSKQQVEDSGIGKLPYLRAVIKETLRLHSVVPLVSYRAEANVQLQGYTIPKGSNVLVNLWAIHHSTEVWTEPHKFVPERFLDKEVEFWGRNFELLPFGSGRHMCLGLPLANRMLHVMLGSLLHQFEWTLPDVPAGSGDVDMTEKYGLVLSMATPIRAIVKKK